MKLTVEEWEALGRRLLDWEDQTGGWEAPVWRELREALGIEPRDDDEEA